MRIKPRKATLGCRFPTMKQNSQAQLTHHVIRDVVFEGLAASALVDERYFGLVQDFGATVSGGVKLAPTGDVALRSRWQVLFRRR